MLIRLNTGKEYEVLQVVKVASTTDAQGKTTVGPGYIIKTRQGPQFVSSTQCQEVPYETGWVHARPVKPED